MIFKPKIKKVLQSVSILFTALICALTINTLQTHASESGTDAVASSIVDSLGITGTGGDDTIKHGVWHTKTGYLCYLLDKNGQKIPSTNAIALSSPGFYQHDGTQWIAESRKGGYIAGRFNGTADWNCTPWQESNNGVCATNEPTIRAWFEKDGTDGAQNALIFVRDNWGNVDPNIPHKFGQGEYYLVIETLMHFQYSVKAGSTDGMQEAIDAAYAEVDKMSDAQLMYRFKLAGFPAIYETWLKLPYSAQSARADIYRTDLKYSVKKKIEEAYGSGGRTFVGDPVIGTVPNLIEYKHAIGTSTIVFNSFTNKVACFAEYIQPGNIGEQIGFTAWNGSTSSQLTDQQVQDYGVAMMVISAKPQGQTTADEPKIPTPHAPAKESDGTYSIVKSYRTKEGSTLKDDGTFSIQNISNEIQIESEQKYQVVGWKVTSTTSTSISSINWNPPGSTQAQGTTASTVTIQDPYKCLYVLLEKLEDTPTPEPPAEPYNYKLTESSIARRVHFTAPDHRLSMPHIENHNFKWIIPAHQTSCPGHTFTDACHGQHSGPHTSSCEKACPATCTQEHPTGSHLEGCDDPHYYDCGTRCQTQYASCSGWQWHEKQLKLSINNTQQSNYPDVLATKSGWNTEPQNSKLTKHYYLNDASFERTSTSSQSYSESNWDYVAVLLRGKDKLTVAEWQNAGQGNGLSNQANTNLQGVSSSGFAVSNQDSGTRKTQDYMETFSTYFNTEELVLEYK